GSGVVEFWKNLLDARIIFPIPQDFEDAELNALDSYSTIKDNQICLNKSGIIDSDGMLYENGECTSVRLPSILIDNFGKMLCLPDGVFFLRDEDNGSKLLIRPCYLQLCELIENDRGKGGPASAGCAITGTPGIGKTYFGLYLLFYIRYKYPNAIIVWQCNEKICYQFSPDSNVQKGDIYKFDMTLNNRNNFLLVDAQALTFKYKAYMILFTSPKRERFNDALKWTGFSEYFMPIWDQKEIKTLWDLQYKNKKNKNGEEFTYELFDELLGKWGPIPRSVLSKWDNKTYQNKFNKLIESSDLETFSGRLIHLDVTSNFTKVVYRFASPKVANLMIEKYLIAKRTDVRNLITSSNDPITAVFRGNLFEDYAHLELQRGGMFRVRCLNDNSGVTEINIKNLEYKSFSTPNNASKECYNRPNSKTFKSIDSFSLDDKTLNLYQITISNNHGIKIVQIKVLEDLLTWINDADNTNLYFVVPSNIFETFPLQKYKTIKDKDSKTIPTWINKKITQYALEINLDISNKSAKKRSSDAMSGDYKNEETNEDVKKRKLEKSDAMLRDDEIGETSGSNVISGQRNLKRSSNVIDNESEDASKSEVVKKRKMRKTDAIVEDESGKASKKRKNKKDVKKRNKK
ncbi:11129_t:CDS:2, partial [Cetraspora pellucida]